MISGTIKIMDVIRTHRMTPHCVSLECYTKSKHTEKPCTVPTKRCYLLPQIFPTFLLTILLLVISSQGTSGQSSTLNPRITAPATLFVERLRHTLTCQMDTTLTYSGSGPSPLTWLRDGSPIDSATYEYQSLEIGDGSRNYQNKITFIARAEDNARQLVCSAQIGSANGQAVYVPEVILVPNPPVVTGETAVNAGEEHTWKCEVDGASIKEPNVNWRAPDGTSLPSSSVVTTQSTVYFNNTVYKTTKYVTTSMPEGNAIAILTCKAVHYYNRDTIEQNSYEKSFYGQLTISVLFKPVLMKDHGDTLTVTVGQTNQAISCIIDASNPSALDISWTKDGETINQPNLLYQDFNVSSTSLVIKEITQSNAGQYSCTVTNSRGQTTLTPTQLIVRYVADIKYPGSTTFEGSLGSAITLSCPVNSNPEPTNIRWYKVNLNTDKGTLITIDGRFTGGKIINKQYGLTISDLESEDAGSYYCEADNDVGTGVGPRVSLTVNVNPFINVPASVRADEGDTFTISVEVVMFPAATDITWFKDNVQIDVTQPANKYQDGTSQTPSLTIRNADPSDSGVYRIRADNTAGPLNSKDIPVTVIATPVINIPVSVTADEGDTFTISIDVNLSPTANTIIWYKDNVQMDVSQPPNKYLGGTSQTPSLTIRNADPSDSGVYRIRADNGDRVLNSNDIPVTIRYEPLMTVTSTPSTLTAGNRLTLQCAVNADPPANVRWTRNGVQVATTSSFIIDTTASSDYTEYMCTASNVMGTVSKTITPDIQFPPESESSEIQNVQVTEGDRVTLTCIVRSNPAPSVYAWYRENNVLSGETDRTLTIPAVGSTDLGSYSCSATNSLGDSPFPARQFDLVEGSEPAIGASTSDSGLSTATIILIIIIVIIILIIIILVIIFCCLQGTCAKWCGKKKETAKVAPSYHATPIPAGVYNGGYIGGSPQQNGAVVVDKDTAPVATLDPQFGAIISVPEKSGNRAHRLPPLTTDTDVVTSYYREEKRRSRKKRRKNRTPREEDRTALTEREESRATPQTLEIPNDYEV